MLMWACILYTMVAYIYAVGTASTCQYLHCFVLVPDTSNGNYITMLHGHYKLIVDDYDMQKSYPCRYIAIIFARFYILPFPLTSSKFGGLTYVSLSVGQSLPIKLLHHLFFLFTLSPTFLTLLIMSLNVEIPSPNAVPHSYTSSITQIAESEEVDVPKDKMEEASGNMEVDWENDPDNARNWSFGKKWTAIAIVSTTSYNPFLLILFFSLQVSFYTFVSPLASSMMAPGLPEIAAKYGITNATVVALTLSIYLLAYALGVGMILFLF